MTTINLMEAKRIFKKEFEGKKPSPNRFFIKYGPPGSGKASIMQKVMEKEHISQEQLVDVDLDALIKQDSSYIALTEQIERDYLDKQTRDSKLQNAYFAFRRGYDEISDDVLNQALMNKFHVSWETTGNTISWTLSEINRIKRMGYEVCLVYPLVPFDTLYERVQKRGTQVNAPKETVKAAFDNAIKNLEKLVNFVDSVYIYDNAGAQNSQTLLFELHNRWNVHGRETDTIPGFSALCERQSLTFEKREPYDTINRIFSSHCQKMQ